MPRILILDDEASVRSLLRVVLGDIGYDVSESATADGAITLQDEHPADLLITDIFLPEADAQAKMLELVFRNPSMKVIAMSGAANQDIAISIAKLLGARTILQKPFGIQELLEVVCLQIAELRQEYKESSHVPSSFPRIERSYPSIPRMN